jgi:hypothetical protein
MIRLPGATRGAKKPEVVWIAERPGKKAVA